jgi:hypothetical protein
MIRRKIDWGTVALWGATIALTLALFGVTLQHRHDARDHGRPGGGATTSQSDD